MRGKPRSSTRRSPTPRIIPAHAGQTSLFSVSSILTSDHPRACGANSRSKNLNPRRLGSSPRMRGKRCVGRVQHPWPRIIPAHAGQTEKSHQKQWFAPDHPRACGANLPPMPAIPIAAGSSPRMRGKLTLRRRHDHCERIIPAHAGQTDLDKFYGDVNADHPRACGANPCRPPIRWMNTGSSPRMRGKRRGPARQAPT